MFAPSTAAVNATTRSYLDQFTPVCKSARLTADGTSDIACVDTKEWELPGIYLWSVVIGAGDEYVIYVGKTKSLRRRIQEYRRGFQAHSPNDYKLRVFQSMIQSKDDSVLFRLYFRSAGVERLTDEENTSRRQFDPLLNRRAVQTSSTRADFERSFAAYYAAGFAHFFNGASDA